MIGLYGLAIWTGLTLGPPIGECCSARRRLQPGLGVRRGAPLLGAVIASRLPESVEPGGERARGPIISARLVGPGGTFALSVVGFAAVSAFIVLSLDERGIGHGAEVFSVFAATVVATRLVAGGLPDRIGARAAPSAPPSSRRSACRLLGAAESLPVVIVGAIGMGPRSRCFPSLSLLAVDRVVPERRGAAMGTFTASFDLGMLVGSPAVGAAAAAGRLPAPPSICAAAPLAAPASRHAGASSAIPAQAAIRPSEAIAERLGPSALAPAPQAREAMAQKATQAAAGESTIDRKLINKLTESRWRASASTPPPRRSTSTAPAR